MPTTMKVRLTNLALIDGVLTADAELLSGPLVPTTPPPAGLPLPPGFNTNAGVGRTMFFSAMERAGLTPIGVQGKGPVIIAALKATYPDLDVYLSPSDAPVWPGFGSLDVTIDSGKGGWSFRIDHVTAWKPVGQR